jgi:hypothetical protein
MAIPMPLKMYTREDRTNDGECLRISEDEGLGAWRKQERSSQGGQGSCLRMPPLPPPQITLRRKNQAEIDIAGHSLTG